MELNLSLDEGNLLAHEVHKCVFWQIGKTAPKGMSAAREHAPLTLTLALKDYLRTWHSRYGLWWWLWRMIFFSNPTRRHFVIALIVLSKPSTFIRRSAPSVNFALATNRSCELLGPTGHHRITTGSTRLFFGIGRCFLQLIFFIHWHTPTIRGELRL